MVPTPIKREERDLSRQKITIDLGELFGFHDSTNSNVIFGFHEEVYVLEITNKIYKDVENFLSLVKGHPTFAPTFLWPFLYSKNGKEKFNCRSKLEVFSNKLESSKNEFKWSCQGSNSIHWKSSVWKSEKGRRNPISLNTSSYIMIWFSVYHEQIWLLTTMMLTSQYLSPWESTSTNGFSMVSGKA